MRIAIVEDEDSYAQILQEYLIRYSRDYGQELDASRYADGISFLNSFKGQYDLILLDISMPMIDGMETARRIRSTDPDVVILFVTNLAQYAIRGYEVDALDYILKPISYFAFSQRLNRAIGRVKSRIKNFLVLTVRSGTYKLDVDSIYYVESQAHNLIFHTETGEFTISGTMKEIEEKLLNFHFFRCNKGYLVALRHVDSIQDGCAIVRGQPLLISRARKNEFMDALTNFVGGVVL
ncbi:MAG: LytTR family DNA-binding domain-containing protein [Eubacteriales bacterium]|nr:LytTR family DNA-binding domain-containing protein [Eubacteriales bacterium]